MRAWSVGLFASFPHKESFALAAMQLVRPRQARRMDLSGSQKFIRGFLVVLVTHETELGGFHQTSQETADQLRPHGWGELQVG